MLTILISILVIGLIGAALAAILVISEKYLANYGQCKITINKDKEIDLEGGVSLLEALMTEKIFIPSACGGRGTCGYCKCKVKQGGGPLLPTETPFLSMPEIEDDIRLSCQIKVRQDIQIELPEELLAVQQYQTVCSAIEDLTYDIKLFRFELKEPVEMKFMPGQYAQLLAPEYPGSPEEVYRAYSIASDPEDKKNIELIIRKVPGGICTTYCFEHLKIGDTVYLNGAYGKFQLSNTNKPMIFIAGGSGMAPLKCLLHQMVNEGIDRECKYFFGGNKLKDQFYAELMAEFESKLPNFKFIPVIANPPEDDSWKGATGLVTEAVGKNYDDTSGYEAYLCGSPGLINACVKVLGDKNMPEENIFYDKFA